jgi:hypothetical protein
MDKLKEALRTMQAEISGLLAVADPGSHKAAIAADLMACVQLIAQQTKKLEKLDQLDADK